MSSTDVESNFEASCELSKYHQHLRNETRERLKNLFTKTPALRDLNYDVTVDEIVAEIAIVNGESIKVYLTREPYEKLKVIVPKNSTVRDLKAAIRRTFTAHRNRQRSQRCTNESTVTSKQPFERQNSAEIIPNISWKYIWRTYYLQNDTDDVLINDEQMLSEYNVRNKCILKFVKKIKIDRRMQRNKLKDKQK